MQNGTEMMNDGGQVTMHLSPEIYKDRRYYPGIEARRFYTDFANPAKDVYCWNETMESALDLFSQNRVGIMFGYSYSLPLIKEKAPKLNFSIAKMPQISGNPIINYANYWVESVYSRSPNIEVAWDLIQFMAAEEENVKLYLQKTKKPSALRTLRDQQLNDLEIGIFAEQALTAQSWYKGHDPKATEAILKEMIQMAVQGQANLTSIAELQVRKIQQTVKRK
jgi:ABC-type glycerol-3-phosphate transport system substrate-binding protein